MKVFLDANILFSASNAAGPTARAVRHLLNRAKAVTCDYAAEEARRNICAKRPAWAADFDTLMLRVEMEPTSVFALPVSMAEKGIPILCSAIRSGCQLLVTNDKRDFGHLYGQTVHNVTVISLLALTQILTDPNATF